MNVSLPIMPSYDKALCSFAAKELDTAFIGSMDYILVHATFGVEALSRQVNREGTTIYHGVLVVRKYSNIRSIREMKGKRLTLVDATVR